MCGIVGVISNTNDTFTKAFDMLKCIEYRGYDSFGFAFFEKNSIKNIKKVGSVSELIENDLECLLSYKTNISIGHTRWASHGDVSVANAHPHSSYDKCFSIVHNGIIENHKELKEELKNDFIAFSSDTDSEIIAHLLAKYYNLKHNMLEAIRMTNSRLCGSFTYLFITTHDINNIYGSCNSGTLSYQNIDTLSVIASDQIAISRYSDKASFLEDGDIIQASSTDIVCYSSEGKVISNNRYFSIPKIESVEKGTYPWFMIKEINETPQALHNSNMIDNKMLNTLSKDIINKELCIVGAGSSFFTAQIGQYFFSIIANKNSIVHPSDEFLNLYKPSSGSFLIALSQSGETYDTVEVVRKFSVSHAVIASINNVEASTCQRLAKYPILQACEPELSVLSTKSVSSQVLLLYKIAVLCGYNNNTIDQDTCVSLLSDCNKIEKVIFKFISEQSKSIEIIAKKYISKRNCFFIGNNLNYPVAMESALKFKEVSYYHAEGISSGSLKHGCLSLIDSNFYTVAFIPDKQIDTEQFYHILSNISEIQARGGKVIAFGTDDETLPEFKSISSYVKIPMTNRFLNTITFLTLGQLFAYYAAKELERNIDKPRSLAKAVTVR